MKKLLLLFLFSLFYSLGAFAQEDIQFDYPDDMVCEDDATLHYSPSLITT